MDLFHIRWAVQHLRVTSDEAQQSVHEDAFSLRPDISMDLEKLVQVLQEEDGMDGEGGEGMGVMR